MTLDGFEMGWPRLGLEEQMKEPVFLMGVQLCKMKAILGLLSSTSDSLKPFR